MTVAFEAALQVCDARLFGLELRSFVLCELTGLYALLDAMRLLVLAIIDPIGKQA
jgi:hypothetical protein